MRITRLALAGVFALAAAASAQEAAPGDAAWRHFETWLAAISRHEAGRNDEAVHLMLQMGARDLEAVFPHMVMTLRRAVGQGGRRADFDDLFRRYLPRPQNPRRTFTPSELAALAKRGDMLAAAGVTPFLKRAAMLHADIAIIRPESHLTRSAGSGHIVSDGRRVGDEARPWHWLLGRAFLHLVPEAGRDSDVRIWYQAVGTHLWSIRNFTEAVPHIRGAVEIFQRDAEIQFLRGLVHESLAAPVLQAGSAAQVEAMRLMNAPNVTYRPSVRAAAAENAEALDAFQKAVDADPGHHEARIRLGRLLSLDGKHERAANELRAALAGTSEPLPQYYAQLFLGRAEEGRTRNTEARAAYEAAASLYPEAQSPRLALSQLALRSGDREGAARVFALLSEPSREDADPWWRYHWTRVPPRDVWISRMQAAFREAAR